MLWKAYWTRSSLGHWGALPRPANQEMPSIMSWIVCLQNAYAEVLTPSILECNLIWRRGLYWGNQVRGGPNPACLISFYKRKIWTNRQHIEGRWCQETQGKERHLEPKREAWNRSLAHSPQKEPCYQHLDLIGTCSLQSFDIIHFCHSAPWLVVLCYGGPSTLIHLVF